SALLLRSSQPKRLLSLIRRAIVKRASQTIQPMKTIGSKIAAIIRTVDYRPRFRQMFRTAIRLTEDQGLLPPRINPGCAPPPIARVVTPPAPNAVRTRPPDESARPRTHRTDPTAPKAIVVLFSAPPRVYTRVVDYPLRQENNLFFLTNLNQKRATLILMPGNA